MIDLKKVARAIRVALVVSTATTALGFAACTSDDELPRAPLGVDGPAPSYDFRCTDGTTRACGVTIGEHENVLTCLSGTQSCVGGVWATCDTSHGEITAVPGTGVDRSPNPIFSQVKPKALSDADDCVGNPCDPDCQFFDESPDGSIEASVEAQVPRYQWETGRLTGFPGGLVDKGLAEPCESSLDCQFGMRCENVATDAACSHDKCEVGAAFDATCMDEDMCVNLICASKPECCEAVVTVPVACPHDVCELGKGMTDCQKSDSCVAAVCAADATCCSGTWDKGCVEEALSQGAAAGCPTYCDCKPGATLGSDGVTCRMPSSNMTTTTATRATARTSCQGLGTGWDLAKIVTTAENTEVNDVIAGDSWIGLRDPVGLPLDIFVWDDSSALAITPIPWGGGEPKNLTTGSPKLDKDCVYTTTADKWYAGQCTTLRLYVCEGPTEPVPVGGTDAGVSGTVDAGSSTWSQDCVDEVFDTCGAYCGRLPDAGATYLPSGVDAGNEPGQCVEWIPGQSSSCASAELVAGPGCGDSIPICNVGNTTALAGVPFIGFPANSGHLNTYRETLAISDFKNYFECATDQDIAPGECINFTCSGFSGNNKEVMVNPPITKSGTPPITECSGHNNWTLWRKDGCTPPACFAFDSDDAIDCSYPLPADTSNLNLDDVTVTMSGGAISGDAGADAGTIATVDLVQVGGASACTNNAFYVDLAADAVVVCPSACTRYRGFAANLDGEVACAVDAVYGQREYTQIYASTCDVASTRTQWGYLTYETSLPAGTSVQFSVRAAATEAGLSSASWVDVSTAQNLADGGGSDDCLLTGPSGCPIDLFAELGGRPDAAQPYLELRATLVPSSGVPNTAPALDRWDVFFSCPDDK